MLIISVSFVFFFHFFFSLPYLAPISFLSPLSWFPPLLCPRTFPPPSYLDPPPDSKCPALRFVPSIAGTHTVAVQNEMRSCPAGFGHYKLSNNGGFEMTLTDDDVSSWPTALCREGFKIRGGCSSSRLGSIGGFALVAGRKRNYEAISAGRGWSIVRLLGRWDHT